MLIPTDEILHLFLKPYESFLKLEVADNIAEQANGTHRVSGQCEQAISKQILANASALVPAVQVIPKGLGQGVSYRRSTPRIAGLPRLPGRRGRFLLAVLVFG